MNASITQIRDLNGTTFSRLEREAVLRLDAPGRLQVLRGRAWVTINGQPRDWFLVAGRNMTVTESQQLFVQADPLCVIGWRASGGMPSAWQTRIGQLLIRVTRMGRAALHGHGSGTHPLTTGERP